MKTQTFVYGEVYFLRKYFVCLINKQIKQFWGSLKLGVIVVKENLLPSG